MTWTLIGYALLTIGLAGVLFAWFADQSRGRRRCRKCWYDMAAVDGRKCPECGKAHRHEGLLWKTRRRVSLAFVGALVAASCFAAWRVPAVQRDGWIAVTPTWLLIAQFESLDNRGPEWLEALKNRMQSESVLDFHRWYLIRRTINIAANTSADAIDRQRALAWIKASEDANYAALEPPRIPLQRDEADRIRSLSVDGDGALDACASALRSEPAELRIQAISTLAMYFRAPGGPEAYVKPSLTLYPLLAAAIADPDDDVSYAAGRTLNRLLLGSSVHWLLADGRDTLPEPWTPLPDTVATWDDAWPDRGAAVECMLRDVAHPDWRVAALAVWGVLLTTTEAAPRTAALDMANRHPSDFVRHTAAQFVADRRIRRYLQPTDAGDPPASDAGSSGDASTEP